MEAENQKIYYCRILHEEYDEFALPKISMVRADEEVYYIRPYWKEKVKPDDLIYLGTAGTTYPNPAYAITREADDSRWRDEYVFEYVLSGKGHIDCAGQHLTVSAGDFYFLNRMHAHHYYADAEDPFCKIWVNIRGRLVNSLIQLYNISSGVIIRHCNVEHIFREIHDLLATMTVANRTEAEHGIILRIHDLIQVLSRLESVHHDEAFPLSARVKHYIDENSDYSLTPDDIAAHFFLNKAYIANVFRKTYGISPKQYLTVRRMDAARNLLSNSTTPIKAIADTLCFSSSQHFSTAFHQATGLTPIEFRRRSQAAR